MNTVELVEASDGARAIEAGEQEEVVVLRDGKPVAVVTPFAEDDLYWYDVEHVPAFIASIARARAQAAAGQTITHEQLLRELGLDRQPDAMSSLANLLIGSGTSLDLYHYNGGSAVLYDDLFWGRRTPSPSGWTRWRPTAGP